MITKIDSLKNFGVYKDFKWSSSPGLSDFNSKNIIYGWNYSGKTTLSRIFQSLKDKKIFGEETNVEFKIKQDVGDDITHLNFNTNSLNIEIFNTDFIERNLKWDSKENWEPIAFDIGTNVDLRADITKHSVKIDKILGVDKNIPFTDRFKNSIAVFNEFDKSSGGLFTKESTRIQNDIFDRLVKFDKGDFKKIIALVESDLAANIQQDKIIEELKKTSVSKNEYKPYDEIIVDLKYANLFEEVVALLHASPAKQTTIQIFDDNKEIRDWAEKGISLHKELEECSFCGNPLIDDRIKLLNSYYSNASALLRKSIKDCLDKITLEIELIEKINLPSSLKEIISSKRDDFEAESTLFTTQKDGYVKALKDLSEKLKSKEENDIFNSIEIDTTPHSTDAIVTSITNINEIFKLQREFITNFDTVQEDARQEVKKHYVAKYLQDEEYLSKKYIAECNTKALERINKILEHHKEQKSKIESQLKDILKGKDKLNEFIRSFLNRKDLQIEVTTDDKFKLKRGTVEAKNLSEGEKTAIAFAYFLVKLDGLKSEDKLKETLIFIDDPISSLDSNHIFQVYSLINSHLFGKKTNAEGVLCNIHYFNQLFISTHNFEFFSFLTDSHLTKETRNETDLTMKSRCSYYFIKRISENDSTIMKLPSFFQNYKSEYIYLFDVLHKFNELPNEDKENSDNFLLIPNALRRFAEIYTLLLFPDLHDSIETRLYKLLEEENLMAAHYAKLMNHFSHFTNMEKVGKHDELILNLPDAVNQFISLLQKNDRHFQSLKRAISK
jgi:wobble nucleotide-excising tRNase